MKPSDLQVLKKTVDAILRAEQPTAHQTITFDCDVTDDVLSWLYDYAEYLELKVVNIFSTIFPSGKVRHEIVLRRPGGVWNGSI